MRFTTSGNANPCRRRRCTQGRAPRLLDDRAATLSSRRLGVDLIAGEVSVCHRLGQVSQDIRIESDGTNIEFFRR